MLASEGCLAWMVRVDHLLVDALGVFVGKVCVLMLRLGRAELSPASGPGPVSE